jgi:hypothetical protein
MKKILDLLTSILGNKNLIIFLLVATVVLLAIMHINSCNRIKQIEADAKQDNEAMKKVMTVTTNKLGEQQTSVVAYVGQVNDLKTYSSGLEAEVKALKNRKPEIVIQTKLVYAGDTSKIPNTLVNEGNGNYKLDWNYMNRDSSRTLRGTSSFNASVNFNKSDFSYKMIINPGETDINTDIIKLDMTVGVAKNKKTGFDEIYVTPKSKNVTIGKLEGAILNKPKDKRFSLGPMVGYGISYGAGRLGMGPFVGVALQYSIIKF